MGQEDELEFATKEDLEAINADPRLLKVYKSMQAGVQKKFQGFNETVKQLKAAIEESNTMLQDYDARLTEWEDYGSKVNPVMQKLQDEGYFEGGNSNERGNGRQDRGQKGKRGQQGDDESDQRYERLMEQLQKASDSIDQKFSNMGRTMSMIMQMGDLRFAHPKMDAKKVLEHATKNSIFDLSRAYDDLYKDDIIKEQVEAGVNQRFKEESDKRKTKLETGGGSESAVFELPKDRPKTMAEAGKQFLEERSRASEESNK